MIRIFLKVRNKPEATSFRSGIMDNNLHDNDSLVSGNDTLNGRIRPDCGKISG